MRETTMDGDNTNEEEEEEEAASIKPVVGRHLCGRTLPGREDIGLTGTRMEPRKSMLERTTRRRKKI